MEYTGIKSIDKIIEEKIAKASERKYFVRRELDECNNLIPEVEKVVEDYKNALKPWYKTSWGAAWDAARHAAWDAAWDAGRGAVWDATWYATWYATAWYAIRGAGRGAGRGAVLDAIRGAGRGAVWDVAWYAVWDVAWYAVWYAVWYAARDAAWDAAWEVIRDIKGYENNPFEKIVKIYDMGLYPRGFRKVDGIEKFIVDFPLKTYELGCWAEGDKEILYKHKWNEDCSNIRPVKTLRIIE
jgi:hypothetical protein